MKFNLICADPPWSFSDKLQKMKAPVKRGAQSQYQVLSSHQIARLDVPAIVDPDWCVLALWVPSTLLPQGFEVMKAWGFDFKQTVMWAKIKKSSKKEVDMNRMTSVGMGRLFRQSHELALIGTSGKVYSHLQDHSQRSVMFDVNKGHSIKPELLQDRLETMFPTANMLEIFARRVRPNWAAIGDGVTGKDVTLSIQDLIAL